MVWAWTAVFIPAIVLIVGATVLRRWMKRGAEHNDVAGSVFQGIGGLYAVLLAFIVVNEWNSLQEASTNTFAEANDLGALYWDARALPPDLGRDLEATTKQYARVVIDQEWPLLGDGGYSPRATELVYRMRDEINALPADSPRAQSVFEHALTKVNDLESARRERLSENGHNVSATLWVALAVGAVVTVGFTFLFGLPRFWSHLMIAGSLATLVALALILILMLDQPFAGVMAVEPEAFDIFLRGLPPQR
ncbi:fumarate reductase subunit D [Nocardia transvalensis]|uniref:Fumarate reductase subunit D n=1 Tax=Nocardia transvalensis TaxID=37333 RepID=A0A7W9ULK6_9NOCA|nr:DUF4239 domain-containing protein [Nocardia transvalensis]MBB5917462.1 fumarate reductase subunit D [Nocardia transvalensis]